MLVTQQADEKMLKLINMIKNGDIKVNSDIESVKNLIKGHIILRGKNIAEVAKELKAKYGRSDNAQNLGYKINNGTLKFIEAIELFDVIDYDIEIKDRKIN